MRGSGWTPSWRTHRASRRSFWRCRLAQAKHSTKCGQCASSAYPSPHPLLMVPTYQYCSSIFRAQLVTVKDAACAENPIAVLATGLQILEDVIKFRWGALPDEQREGIKTYISNLIIKLCSDERSFRAERIFLNKMDMILVQVGAPQIYSGCCAVIAPLYSCRLSYSLLQT